MYEEQLLIVDEQQKLLELYQISIANHLTTEANHQEHHELQSPKINLLQLQILELQKFIFSGRQEKFTPVANSNERPTALLKTIR